MSKFNLEIGINFFAEYHGKSECDRHFGFISRIYTDRCSYGNVEVCTTEDYLELYKTSINRYGRCVIPAIGPVSEELVAESGKASNVVALRVQLEGQAI